MNNFTKLNIKDIPIEQAHGGSGSRKVLVNSEHAIMTKGFLKPGSVFDWHIHQDIDEIFIVLKGKGKFYCEDEVTDYKVDDVIIVPGNLNHKIEAGGKLTSEYYFIRVKAK